MNELEVFAYLSRFSAARLIAWWERRPADRKWLVESWMAIGAAKYALLGFRLKSSKLAAQCASVGARLRAEMLGPDPVELEL